MLPVLLALPLIQDVPHGQDRPPNEPRTAQEALEHFELPEGFHLELVAAEPDLVNPIAMAFDGAGRLWVTESLEYPRSEPGVGRDRVKILSDQDHDGTFEHVEIFAEGLNIPSGIEVTPGSVWVANAPDLLRWDREALDRGPERSLTGFGRDDTHELPNSLTVGPDGMLYGLNGVFNRSTVSGVTFTCAAWRCNAFGAGFELFAEGTSNPWGIAFDPDGSLFVSACVIDHLWHLAEDGYYHRQAGAYPPHTWKAGSIVDHRHQKAAYCGLHYLDSDRYPEPYRGVLVMGNLHGAALNVDRAEQRGSTYHARELPDLLRANDAWFMPVSMLTGPDGYLYVLDWYDRYHCYQDARRDPEGIDRGRGRLWRVVHEDQPYEPWTRDLARETDHKLLRELGAPNDALRRLARLEIASRRNIQTSAALEGILLDAERPRIERLEALYALATGWGAPVEAAHLACLSDADPGIRAWAVRLARRTGSHAIMVRVRELFEVEQDPRVQLQLASAWPDFEGRSNLTLTLEHLYGLIDRCGDDPIVPRVVWRQLVGMLTRPRAAPLEGALPLGPGRGPAWDEVYPRLVGLLLEQRQLPLAVYALRASQGDQQLTADALVVVREQVQTGELRGEELERLEAVLELDLQGWLAGDPTERLTLEAALLATALGDERGLPVTRHVLGSPKGSSQTRLAALEALVAADDPDLLTTVEPVLADPATPTALRGELIAALGRLDRDEVGALVVRQFAALEPALQPRAVSLCLQRLPWARSLLAAMPEPVPPTLLNASQALRIAAFGDPELDALLEASWGRVRAARNPDREAVIARGRRLVREGGDAHKGAEVFTRVCATCHTIHGEGANVGPDVTGTGRGDLMQLLSNVFDPSLVVGADYRQQVVRTVDGRILGGLLVEDSQDRIVLRVEGGRDEVIPREDVDVSQASSTSLMPEGFEAQLTQDELRDLLAFLVLDGPPGDPNTRMIPGAGLREIETEDPAEFGAILAEVAPGFTCDAVGDDGMALEAEHLGRPVVVRSHPVSPTVPAVLYGTFNIPEDASLLIRAAHHPRGDWRMIVRVGEEVVLDVPVTKETCQEGWMERWVDLGPWQNQQVFLRIENHATGWHNEYGYWGAIEIVRGGGSKK